MPSRPQSHACLVPGCSSPGRNQLGVRCRVAHSGASPFPEKRRTDALFSVESAAFLCDSHALCGGYLLLMFEPNETEQATIVAASGENEVEERSKPIKQPLASAA
jgi:hypothetical protein